MYLGKDRCCRLPVKKDIIGPQGAQGNYGPIGEIGLTGNFGPLGPQGATGLCYRGYKGPQGLPGAQGGSTGSQGAPGPAGTTGPNGATGINFYFNIAGATSYNSSPVNLTSFGTPIPGNQIYLGANYYSIKWSVFETWSDPYNNFGVVLNNGNNNYYPEVYTSYPSGSTAYAILNNNGFNTLGSGNDILDLTSVGGATTYSINLYQYTNYGPVNINAGETANFSIAFVPTNL
jgi:hypothetical protein